MIESVEKALIFAQEYFKSKCCGHDFEHVFRVYENAQKILKDDKLHADEELVLLGAVLHDVDDVKLVCSEEAQSYKNTKAFLDSINLEDEKKNKVIKIISTVSFLSYLAGEFPDTLEGRIVFDADKLDQVGAAAIARSFAYGAKHGRLIFDPNHFPSPHYKGKYPNGYASSMNYIIEVLLNMESRFYTNTAREIAKPRIEFMKKFLEEFFIEENRREWIDYFSKTKY